VRLSFRKRCENAPARGTRDHELPIRVVRVLAQELLVRLCRAREALQDVDADVTVAALARASRLSRSQFIARYRAAFGATPHQTRMRARLERARWLLATSALTVTEVCMAVGFSSLGSFSHLFRMRCGESPQSFRNRMATLGESTRLAQLAPHCLPLMAAAWAATPYFSRSATATETLESAG
jgi:transcriptional regulator GlxA family with amidase domain